MILSMTIRSSWTVAVMPFTLLAVFFAMAIKTHMAHQLEARLAHIEQLTMLRHWVRAVRIAWRLLPSLVTRPTLRNRAITAMAACLDQLGAYDAAIVTFDDLIEHLPNEHPSSVRQRLDRCIAQLANGQLTDADNAIRKLRSRIDTPLNSATYRLALLIQQVRTNHWLDAIDQNASDLVDQLRPLGVEAGYGYALMALSYHMLAENDPLRCDSDHEAQLWWSRATLLLPVTAMIDRFAELASLAHFSSSCPLATTTML